MEEELKKDGLLNPKNDYVFKRIFGYVGNENITKGLINAVLDEKIENVVINLKEGLEQDIKSDKYGILDIRAETDKKVQIDIEMQMVDKRNTESRILFYWSKMFAESVRRGEDYIKAKKTVVIIFTDYEIKGLEEIKKYRSKWQIREEEYKQLILTDKLEIDIIELPKFERYRGKKEELERWIKFITDPGGMKMEEMKEDKALEEAKEVLKEISGNEIEEELAFQRLLWKWDQQSLKESGYEQGKEEGIKEGIKEKAIEVAKKMLELNIEIDVIEKVTGLTKEEIKTLMKK